MLFSQKDKEQIIKMYKNQESIDSIIVYFQCREKDIRVILKENYLDRAKNQKFSKELENRIITMHQNNKLHKEISNELLVSSSGINKVLDRNNIPRMSASMRNQKYDRNSFYFDDIDTPNKAYILGLLYADGNLSRKNQIIISLQEEDGYIIKQIKNELEYTGNIAYVDLKKKSPKWKNQYRLAINDSHMAKELINKGLVYAKSLVLQFPDFLSSELTSYFIRGYYDGDGNIWYDNKRNKCQVSICGTNEMIQGLSIVLTKLNIKHNIYSPKQCKRHNTFVLRTCGNKSSYAILSWLYKDASMKILRKYNYYLNFCEKYNKVPV